MKILVALSNLPLLYFTLFFKNLFIGGFFQSRGKFAPYRFYILPIFYRFIHSCGAADDGEDCPKDISEDEPTIPFALDISDPDMDKISTFNGIDDGISYRQYFAKPRFQITAVTDEGTPIWIAGPGIDFVSVVLFSDEYHIILVVELDIDKYEVSKYFQRVNGEWKEISEAEYDDIVDDMMEESDESNTE